MALQSDSGMLLDYLRRLFEIGQRGEAREESYYSSLEELLLRYAAASGRPGARVTTIPKRTEGSVLDFQVWLGDAGRGVGYVEAKRPGTDLDRAEKSEQVKRYLRTFPNLILTDFHEFRLYRGDEEIARARIAPRCMADLLPRASLDHEPDVVGGENLLALLDLFFSQGSPRVWSAASLAVTLAGRARILASRIEELLDRDLDGTSPLTGYYQVFSEYLIAGLTRGEFADLYAQTIAYGMLAARWRAREAFDRRSALGEIPRGNGILRDVFKYISLDDPPPEVRWVLDDLAGVLAAAPVREILGRYFHESRGRDPVLHFYETFLARYDPELRKQRGVYYTPQPLVSYVVRSVHRLLETRLGLAGGLAHPGVRLLDPAAGTLTFVIEAMRRAVAEHRRSFGEGSGPALIRDQLLRNFAAFELMMAPYAIGHLKAHLVLEEMGCPLEEGQRFGSFLTDALDGRELEQTPFPGMSSLSRESWEAGRWKKEVPDGCAAFVVVGNPPYFGHSANRGKESADLLKLKEGYVAADGRRDEGYYQVDGRRLDEANPRWLQDDYVKFLRFAQRKVDQAGQGVVGFVTNHGYLDNPTFRGMRRSLLGTFDEIYLLDLHDNAKKKERAPDGSADENVFDGVRQGIAVALLVKKPGLPKRVLRFDLHGGHGDKLRWLEANDVESTPWTGLSPYAPGWLFAPRDVRLEEEYLRGIPLPEIFPVHSVGVVTARDAFALDFEKWKLEKRIVMLQSGPHPELFAQGYGLPTPSWNLEEAGRRAREDEDWQNRFVEILYRPFDVRWAFYADYVIERPREAVMRHMTGGNLGLIAPRQSKEGLGALVTDRIIGHKAVSAYDINYLFPLYLQPEAGEGLFRRRDRVPNLSGALPRFLERLHGESPTPEKVLAYVYAVLYSPAYRERYAPLLQGDFPRIPFPRDRRLFAGLAVLGEELIGLHLHRPERLGTLIGGISPGSGRVTKMKGSRRYDPATYRVRINEEGQGFEGIPPEVWSYRIGGYQVLDRWLQARAGRILRSWEMTSFSCTATALLRTIEVQGRIDPLYRAIEQGVGAGIEVG
jgi:hypothetical protein